MKSPTASQSVILDQVTNGLAVRMAVLYLCGGIASMTALIIRGGRVIDPANKRDEIADCFCRRRKNCLYALRKA